MISRQTKLDIYTKEILMTKTLMNYMRNYTKLILVKF